MSDIKNLSASTKFKKTPIGEIPVDWSVVKLDDVAEIGSGDSAPQDARYFENGTHLFIRTSDVGKVGKSHRFGVAADKVNDLAVKELGLKQWPKGTILFPKSGASTFLNHRVLLSEPAYVSSHLAAIVVNNHSAPEFLYYYLSTIDAKSLVPDTNYPSLRLSDLASIHVPLPPLPEQEKIADILTSVDDTIEKTQQLIEQTKKLQQALTQKLLTKGIPGLHKRYVNTFIGEIPEYWEIAKIGDLCEVVGGSTPSTKEPDFWGGDILWAIPTDITSLKGNVIYETEKKITQKGLENCAARIIPVGSILLTSRATIGECAINMQPMSTNQGFINLICKKTIHNWFLFYLMRFMRNYIIRLGNGSTFNEVPKKSIRLLKIPLPSIAEQRKIAEILLLMDDNIQRIVGHKIQLESIKQSLLQVLLTGKVRLKNASL